MEKQLKKNVVMVLRIGSLGDTLIALPSFHLIRQAYPDSKIILLTNTPIYHSIKAASSFHILNGTGLIDGYLEYPHGDKSISSLLGVIQNIRKKKPDLLIYLMPNRTFAQRLRDFVFFVFSGITHFRGIWGAKAIKTAIQNKKTGLYESEASRLVRSIGFNAEQIQDPMFSINITQEEKEAARKFIAPDHAGKKYISLSVGTKISVNDWGENKWKLFISELAKFAVDYELIFIGSKDEAERSDELLKLWPFGGVNLCGLLTPRISGAALAMTTLFIGHDSGPIHLASSVGIPSVGIYASRNKKGTWFPFANENNIFYTEISCSGCRLTECTLKEKQCINAIQPIDVVHKVSTLLISQIGIAS